MIAGRSQMALADALAARLKGDVVLVGVGNPLRGDDAAGCLVAEGLDGTPGLKVIHAEDVPECYFGKILACEPDVVVLVDAVDLGQPVGSIAMLGKDELVTYEPSTHRVPLALTAELIQGATGADVFVLGIQPLQVELGAGVSPSVARAVASLVETIRRAGSGNSTCGVHAMSRAREVGAC